MTESTPHTETSADEEHAGPDQGMMDRAVDDLILRVGERVRRFRTERSMPRRELARLSGLSERYLAQLESGRGNVSIGLLQKVALALAIPVEDFVREGELRVPAHLARLFSEAPENVQASVYELLSSNGIEEKRARRICLLGLRGAGKSTLGKLAAKRLGLPFRELNEEIEKQAGLDIGELIALYGQEGYRQLEQRGVERIIEENDTIVLAAAGGIVADPQTFGLVLENFHTIWLRATADEHMARVKGQGDTRPMAGNPMAMEQLRSILTGREVGYARADRKVDTSGRNLEQSLDDLLDAIRSLPVIQA